MSPRLVILSLVKLVVLSYAASTHTDRPSLSEYINPTHDPQASFLTSHHSYCRLQKSQTLPTCCALLWVLKDTFRRLDVKQGLSSCTNPNEKSKWLMGTELRPRNWNITLGMLMTDVHSWAVTYIAARTHHFAFSGHKAKLQCLARSRNGASVMGSASLRHSKPLQQRLHVNMGCTGIRERCLG